MTDELDAPATSEELEAAARLARALDGGAPLAGPISHESDAEARAAARSEDPDAAARAAARLLEALGPVSKDELSRARLRRALVSQASRRARPGLAFWAALAASLLLAVSVLVSPRAPVASSAALLDARERAARAAVSRLAAGDTSLTASVAAGLRETRLTSIWNSVDARRLAALGESDADTSLAPSAVPTRSSRTGGASS